MKNKHTPDLSHEEWKVVLDMGDRLHIAMRYNMKEPHKNYGICQMHGEPGKLRNMRARLIAAAPDYDSCAHRLLAAYDRGEDMDLLFDELRDIMNKVDR